jgi:hypothetical protein
MKTTSQLFRRLALLLGSTTLLFTAWAQNQATLTPIGKWPDYPMPFPGGSYALRVAGSYAYLAGSCGPSWNLRLVILDIGTPAEPRYLSHVDTQLSSGSVPSLHVQGNYAYVAAASGLAVFDVSRPEAPALTGTCLFTGAVGVMDVAGSRVYVGTQSIIDRLVYGEVLVFDASDPTHPVVRTTVPGSVFGFTPALVSATGDYVYAAGHVRPGPVTEAQFDYVHIDVIDVSNPDFPFVASGYDKPDRLYPQAMCVQDGLLHLAYWGNEVPSGYEVFDLSDPLYPSPLDFYALQPTEYIGSLRLVGHLAYLTTSAGLRVFDFSDPRNLRLIALFVFGSAEGFAHSPEFDLAGEYAYWSDLRGEMWVLQLTNPAAPVQVGRFDTGFWRPWISLEGDVAYLFEADSKRFRVLDVSNPDEPALVGAKDFTSAGPFKVVGQCGYVAAGAFLQVLDLSNPSQPVEAGRFNAPCNGLDVVGNRAYVTGSSPANRLSVIEVTNPAAPRLVGYSNLPGSPGPPQVVGNFAYYRLEDTHLVIVDIRNPSQIVEVGRYYATNGLGAFQVSGPYAYLLRRSWGEDTSLHVVSMADPAHPTRVGLYAYDPATVTVLQNLCVSGLYVLISLSESVTNRVDILDVTYPTRPVKAGDYSPESQFSSFVMSGSTLYAAGDAGLTVLDFFAPNVSPRLRLNQPVLASGVAVLTWEGGPAITLQKSTSLTNPNWQDVPGTTGQSLAILPQADAAFFRLTMP